MLKPLLLFAMLSFYLTGCKPANGQKKNTVAKEFEGIITYHETLKGRDTSFNIDDTVLLLYSHGNYVGVHSSMAPNFHLVRDYYLEKEPFRLLLFNNSDTLHQLSLNFSKEKLESFKVKKINDKILSKNCESIELNTSYSEKDSTTYTDFTFVFSRGYLNVDKQHFKNWNLGFFNKVVNETGAFYLKFKSVHFDSSHKTIISSKSYEVISVQEKPINPIVFKIDTAKIKRYE